MLRLYKCLWMIYITSMKAMDSSLVAARPRRKIIIYIRFLVLGIVIIVAGIVIFSHDRGPIPPQIRSRANYTLYFPTSLPPSYKYDKKFTRQESNIIFYTFLNDKHRVSVSQQPLTSNPPKLDTLSGFNKLEVTAGKAAVGVNGSSPTAIILTNTTIITINGNQGTPQDVVATIAKNMASLPD